MESCHWISNLEVSYLSTQSTQMDYERNHKNIKINNKKISPVKESKKKILIKILQKL